MALEPFARDSAALQTVAAESVKHGLGAVVLDGLVRANVPLAKAAAETLRLDVMTMVGTTVKVKRLLGRANEALRARGVRPVLLKGIGLGARLYGDPLRRPTSDVDLLVAPEEMAASRAALEPLGLGPKAESDDYYPRAWRHHEAFEGPSGLVELHFRLMANWGATWDAGRVLARAVPARLGELEVRYLCPEDELVYLALHAANHMLSRLGWLFDVKLFVRAYPHLDWSRVVAVAREARLPSPAFYALDAANRLVDAQVPAWVLSALAPAPLLVTAAREVFSEDHLLTAYLDHHKGVWAAAKVLLADQPARVALFAAQRLVWNARAQVSGYFE